MRKSQHDGAISKEEIKSFIYDIYWRKFALENAEECFEAAVEGQGISSSGFRDIIDRAATYAGAKLVDFGLAENLAEAVGMLKKEHQEWLDEQTKRRADTKTGIQSIKGETDE